MALAPTRHDATELPRSVVRLIGRYYFGTACAAALVGAIVIGLLPGPLSPPARAGLIAALIGYAAVVAWAFMASREQRRRMDPALFGTGAGAMAIVFFASLAYGDGIRNPTLGFFGLIVCMLCGVTSLRWGAVLAALATAILSGLAWAELHGWIPAANGDTPLSLVWVYQLLVVACGVAGGALLTLVLDHYLRAAAEREERFRNLLGLAVDWYWEQDENLRFTHLAASPTTAAPRDEQRLGRTPWELAHTDVVEQALVAHRADLEAHRPFSRVVVRRLDASGQERFLSIAGEPKFDAGGRFRGYWGVGRDVTDELRAQQATAVSESRYRQLFQRSPSPLLLHRHGIVFDANDAAARLFGFDSVEQMLGFDLREAYVDPDSRRRVQQRIDELEAMAPGGELPQAEFQMLSRKGERLTVQASAARVDTDSGAASLSMYFDLTARVNAESALRRSQSLLSHLIDTSPDLITLTELASGRYELVNRSFERVTGWRADEVVGRTAGDVRIWHNRADRDALVAALRDKGVADDMPAIVQCKSGELVSLRLSAARFEMDGREYLVLNGRDVTATERARLEHDAILQNASIGIAFTRDRFFQHTNPSFDRMFGFEPGQLAGQPTTLIWPHQDDYDAMRSSAAPVLSRGGSYELERQMRRADGSLFWCRMRGQSLDAAAPRGGTIWIAEDVSERRQVDQALAAARDAAEAASRAKSSFLANTSHEIRTPLNGLLGLARLAMQSGLDEPRRQQYLAQIFDSAHSLSGIISDILDLSKIEAGKITLEHVSFGLRDTLTAVHDAYQSLAETKGLGLLLAIDGSVPATVTGDPVRVRQILSNFVTNALKFTERGRIRIHATTTAPDRVRLSVTDTGPGIDADTQQRLFMPFSQADDSTTRRYGGTGLGLSICRELAHLMGGEVGVTSMPGAGSTFWAELRLPPAQRLASEHGELDAFADRLLGARVLMVEDNAVNMMIAVAMLEQWGVEVTQAADGRMALAAVDRAEQEGRPFDVVLMDVQMPHMSGHEAARALRLRYPADRLPIIALTAAALVSERDKALASGMDEFLTKPIDAQRLKETLAQAIARRALRSR
ncbi:MAG TPA: PAS domain S-box protein [Albitalea sp.]|nr:PAS domain S-box protein [Albitalea sp.]